MTKFRDRYVLGEGRPFYDWETCTVGLYPSYPEYAISLYVPEELDAFEMPVDDVASLPEYRLVLERVENES